MELLKKINFKQPKYMIPALIYFPLLFTGYFAIDMFHTEKAEIADPTMQSTEYLNPSLPQARVNDNLGGKYENMLKSYGKIDDHSAIGNIEREDPNERQEGYESKYSDADLAALDTSAMEQAREQARLQEMQEQLRQSALRGTELADGQSEETLEATERERALRAELEQALALLREQSQNEASVSAQGNITVNEHAVSTPSDEEEAQEVVKRVKQSSDYFHTLAENDPQPNMIKAIIDEDIKAVDGSRVRLRLLDDIEIGNVMMPKGSYIYAIMSGFGSQRVKGTVKSLMSNDEIIKVSLSIYDTDGLEGLYVPSSSFRETTKDIASGAMSSNMTMNQGTYNNSLSQWGMQAIQNAYQKTTNAISKSIRKNSAKLKYGTFVYLINGKEKRE